MIKPLSRNLIFLIASLLVITCIPGFFLLYDQLSRINEREVLHSLNKAALQTAINLNTRMDSVEETMQTLLYDTRFQSSVHRSSEGETLEQQLKEIRPMREAVASATSNKYISQIRIFLNDQKMLTREGVNFFSLAEALNTVEYQEMERLNTSHHWMGVHPVSTRYFQDKCITLCLLYQPSYWLERQNRALLLFDISPMSFADVFSGLETPDEHATVVVANTEGKIMIGSGEESVLSEILSASEQEHWGTLRIADDELAYVVQPLQVADWSLILYMPRESLLISQQNIRALVTLVFWGLTLLMAALLIILAMVAYSSNINSYIRTLHENLRSTDYPKEQRFRAHSVLFNLDKSINSLLETNKQLTEEKMSAQLREREVTLQALQAQINPHFLYNTLDSINWMAIRENASDVSSALTALADYFRLSLSRGRSVVTLEEDVKIARKYLTLYEHRHNNEYQVFWDLDPKTLKCFIPKLTLQPLLENALQHGIFIRREKAGGMIRIVSAMSNGQLILTITDNGPGISENIDWNKGYGLGNVRKRLDLYFNNRYEFLLSNAPAGGAIVTVKVLDTQAESSFSFD